MPHDLLYIQPRDDTIRHGSSLAALVALANEFHYQLVECTCYNAFFVKVDLFDKYVRDKIPFEPTMEAVHEVTMGTALYQLYDGTLKLHGCKTMLWHRLPIPDIQVLDKEERSFPFVPSSSSTGPVVSVVEKKTEDGCTWEDQSEEEMFQSISVDMSPYCHPDFIIGDEEEKVKCSQELLKQLETDGFALVRGTTISSELCKDALYWTDEFLHRAPEAVRRSCLTKDRARRGYSPQNAENFASLIGQKGPNDLVKKFRVGPEMAEGRDDKFAALVQPNAWPSEEVWGEENSKTFQRVIEEYYEKLCDTAHAIVACIRDGIRNTSENDLSHLEESLTMRNESHTSILTLLGYRKGARHQGCKIPLVAAHTDVGVITVLLFDDGDCAALQRAEGDNWVDVRIPKSVPMDPIFVVNIGDCLSDLCGGKLPSTMHRVMPRNGKEGKPRNTLALFVGFQPDQKLCINKSLMTYEEWRKNKIAKAQAKARERSA
jgi:isopenicillin N synthase-like dioxygenase